MNGQPCRRWTWQRAHLRAVEPVVGFKVTCGYESPAEVWPGAFGLPARHAAEKWNVRSAQPCRQLLLQLFGFGVVALCQNKVRIQTVVVECQQFCRRQFGHCKVAK